MKTSRTLLFCLALATVLSACGNESTAPSRDDNASSNNVSAVLEAGMAEEDSSEKEAAGTDGASGETDGSGEDLAPEASYETSEDTEASSQEVPPEAADIDVDVDLTILSPTLVYSEVYTMLTEPEDYIGKTVKMEGGYAQYHTEATDQYYFACLIRDAMACCQQGIEFVPTDDYQFPEDYPELSEQITVIGTFDTYLENGYTYCTLRDAVFY